jgi:hypothetical protein
LNAKDKAMITVVSQAEFQDKFCDAFAALPEAYQADHCLEFYVDCNGGLCCAPLESQVSALGNWESVFDPHKNEWFTVVS